MPGKSGDASLMSPVIEKFVAELGTQELENKTIVELMRGLRREFPANDLITKLNETVDLEQEEERNENEYPWILFSIEDTAYGINSKFVLAIELLGEITPIVDGPHYSPGITRSRGEMIDLMDLRALFGSGDYRSAKADQDDAIYMMLVIEVNEVKRGLIVDEIISVEYFTKFDEGIMGDGGKIASQYVDKVAKREKTDAPVLVIRPESLTNL